MKNSFINYNITESTVVNFNDSFSEPGKYINIKILQENVEFKIDDNSQNLSFKDN